MFQHLTDRMIAFKILSVVFFLILILVIIFKIYLKYLSKIFFSDCFQISEYFESLT